MEEGQKPKVHGESMSAILVAEGIITDMNSQRIRTGYNRLFTLQWTTEHKGEFTEHSIPVSAYNEMARYVRDFNDGDHVMIIGEFKATYTEKIKEHWVSLHDPKKHDIKKRAALERTDSD
jgi:hypothetical protein